MRKLLGKTRTCRQDRKLMYGNVRGQAGKGRLRQRIRQKNVQVEEQRGKSWEIWQVRNKRKNQIDRKSCRKNQDIQKCIEMSQVRREEVK